MGPPKGKLLVLTIQLSCLLQTENVMKTQNPSTLLLSLLTWVPLTLHKDTLPILVNHNSKERHCRNVIFLYEVVSKIFWTGAAIYTAVVVA